MTFSLTSRLGLPQWSSPSDNPTRQEFQDGFAAIDAKTLIWLTPGLRSARPAAGTAGRVYQCTDSFVVYLDTGSAWLPLGASIDALAGVNLLMAAGQTGPAFRVLDSSGNTKAFIDTSGRYNGRTQHQAISFTDPATGWRNYFQGLAKCGYWTDSGGFVHLQGAVLADATYGGGSTILADGTLPRPWDGADHVFDAGTMNGGSPNSYGGNVVVPGPIALRVTSLGGLVTQSGVFNSGQNVFLDALGYQSELY